MDVLWSIPPDSNISGFDDDSNIDEKYWLIGKKDYSLYFELEEPLIAIKEVF